MNSHTILQSKLATVGGLSDEQTDAEVRAEMAFYLPLFIQILYAAGTNYGKIPYGTTPNPISMIPHNRLRPNEDVHYPSRDLYNYVFRYLCETNTDGDPILNGGLVTSTFLTAPLPDFPKNGYLMEGALMLAIHVLRLQLHPILSTRPGLNKPNTETDYVRTDSYAYKRLKIVYDTFSRTGSLATDIFEELIRPDLRKMDYLPALEDAYPSAAYTQLKEIQETVDEAVADIVRKKAIRYLRLLGWKLADPEYHMLVVGEGSYTQGILNISGAAGLIFFKYSYSMRNELSSGRTSGKIFTRGLASQILSLQGKNRIHVNLFGVDAAAGAAIFEKDLFGNNSKYALKTNPRVSTLPFKLSRVGTLRRDTNLESNLNIVEDGEEANWYNTASLDVLSPCSSTLVGGWNDIDSDMMLFDTNGSFSVHLRKFLGRIGTEELFMTVCAYEVDLELAIELEQLYGEDRFELSNAQRKEVIDNVPEKINFIDLIINEIRKDTSNIVIEQLKGGFVGKMKSPAVPGKSKVESDTRYQFDLNTTNEPAAGNMYEVAENGNPDLLYSFGTIRFEKRKSESLKNTIRISIESYCSEEWSRLDRRLHFDIRNFGHTLVINGNGDAPSIYGPDGMDQYTIFGYNGSTHAKISSGKPEDPLHNPTSYVPIDIASYNNLLTQLRSFGLLEALFIAAKKRDEELLTSCSGSTDPDLVKTKLLEAMNSVDSVFTHTSPPVPVTYSDYLRFKWYMIETTGAPTWLPVQNGSGGYDIAPGNNPSDFSSLTDI